MDWIKLREEYESSEISLSDLAEKHGLKYPTVKSRKQREKWEKGASTKDASKDKKDASKGASKKTQDASKSTTSKRESKIRVIVNNGELGLEENAELTENQKIFVSEYLVDRNATQAAVRAGYSVKTAQEQGSRLLSNVMVKKLIDQALAERLKRTEISQDEVVNLLANVLRSNISNYVDFGQRDVPVMNMFGPVYEGKGKDKKMVLKTVNYVDFKPSSEVDGSLIQEVKMGKDGASLKLLDKLKAVELLGRHLGMFKDGNINIAVGVQIVDDIGSGEDEPG